MITFFVVLAAICMVLPSRWVVAILPAFWMGQNTLLASRAAILSAGPVDVTPVDFVLASLLLRWVWGIVLKKQIAADKPLYAAIVIFLTVSFLATLAAGVKFGHGHFLRCLTSEARFLSEIALVPVMACAITTLPQARRCIGILLATLAAVAAIQFVNFFGASHGIIIGEVQGIERGELRYFGPVGDSVGFVLLLGYVVSLCFANVIGAGVFLGGILLTAGLGAIFGAGVGTLLFLVIGMQFAQVRELAVRRLWLLPLFALAGVIGVTVLAKPFVKTLTDRVSSGSYASSGGQRVANAKLAGAMLADNPLLGVGYMGYEAALPHYGGEKFFDLTHHDGGTANANNQFLQSLTDAGLLGLIATGALVFCAARLLLTVAKRSEDRFLSIFYLAAFIWLLAQVLGNLAAVWLIPSSFIARFLWIILGTAVAIQRLLPISERENADVRSASTRRHKPAQGNALGSHAKIATALKGRDSDCLANHRCHVPPFQGLHCMSMHSQGVALGWLVGPIQGLKHSCAHT